MAKKARKGELRIVVAVTETSPLRELWHAALQNLPAPGTELVTVYVADDRWQRAASLPFTREFPRTGGPTADFTLRRAEQLSRAAVARVQRALAELAEESKQRYAFRVLSEADLERIHELLGETESVLVAPSILAGTLGPARVEKLGWRVVLIEAPKPNHGSR